MQHHHHKPHWGTLCSTLCMALCVALGTTLLASCGAEKNLKKAEKHLAIGEYYDAAAQYKQAYNKTPAKEREQRGRIARKMALCYNKINATPKAIAAYRNAIRYQQATAADQLQYARQLLKNADYKPLFWDVL